MKIRITEVWNNEGRSKELTTIEVATGERPHQAVWKWILENRPDLELAASVWAHGFHAVEVR